MKESVRIFPGIISGSTLKIIAITAMLIDHIGAAVLYPYLISGMGYSPELYKTYWILRDIGRIAFPIFCFLLTEGFVNTSNVKRYALRLGIFALISEIPFDLAFQGKLIYLDGQNVFFTLFLGLLAMMALDGFQKSRLDLAVREILGPACAILCIIAAELLHTDYGAYGVICILTLYLSRKKRWMQVVAGCAAFWLGDMIFQLGGTEIWAPLGLLPVLFYNGQRGIRLKYIFYLFYPVHLLILYAVWMTLRA